jgi:hypothetical protein
MCAWRAVFDKVEIEKMANKTIDLEKRIERSK